MRLFFLITLATLTSCSSVKTVSEGKKYIAQCHRVTTSDESCAEKVADKCRGGYKIEKSDFDYVFLKGPQRIVTVLCN